jgi:hypothetical protein
MSTLAAKRAISYQSHVTSMVATNEDSGFPIANAKNETRSLLFKATGLTSTVTITTDLPGGGFTGDRVLVLDNTSLKTGDTADLTIPTGGGPVVVNFVAADDSGKVAIVSPSFIDANADLSLVLTVASGVVEVGVLAVNRIFDLLNLTELGRKFSQLDKTILQEGLGGRRVADHLFRRRAWREAVAGIQNVAASAFADFDAYVLGRTFPFFYHHNFVDTPSDLVQARLMADPSYNLVEGVAENVALFISEEL